jgi:transcription antitermination protein NusB
MRPRSRARSWSLQVLYAWEMRGTDRPISEMLADFVTDRRVSEASRAYLFRIVLAVMENLDQLDRTLAASLTNWRLDRLSAIDRSILRISAAEMLFLHDVPPRASIQEAILLAEKYGTDDSPAFVNGVLDALMRRLAPAPQGDSR